MRVHFWEGKWEYYARYDENERGVCVKKVYHLQIRSIRGFKINWLEVKIKCKGAVNESSECVFLFDIIVVVILGEFVCVLLTKVLGFGREQYSLAAEMRLVGTKIYRMLSIFTSNRVRRKWMLLRERFGSSFKNSVFVVEKWRRQFALLHFVMNSSYDFLS